MTTRDPRLLDVDYGMGSMGEECRVCRENDWGHHGEVHHRSWCGVIWAAIVELADRP